MRDNSLLASDLELEELLAPPEPSWDEALQATYEELLRDKRDPEHLPCPTWDWHGPESGCGCHREPGSGHTEPQHTAETKDGTPWCAACQSAHADPHPIVSWELYRRRFVASDG